MVGADAIFLTGDLSQDESEESYKFLVKELRDLSVPIFNDALFVLSASFS